MTEPLVPEDELEFRYFRAGGPGGQNVNKVSTAVHMRFDAANSPSLDEAVRTRLMKAAGSRLTNEGVIQITATRFRTQERNRDDAVERLNALIEKARVAPVKRIRTKPTKGSKERRLQAKAGRSKIKAARGKPGLSD
jgi:ribosome-associated protein